MEHSVWFDNYHTYNDWHLIPQNRPSFDAPEVSYIYDEIPGNTPLNLYYTALKTRGMPIRRRASWTFIVENGHNWSELYSKILTAVHGKTMQIGLDDDPDNYYWGRVTVDGWNSSQQHYSTITFNIDADPFRYGLADAYETITFAGERDVITRITIDSPVLIPAVVTITANVTMTKIILTGFSRDKVTNADSKITIDSMDEGEVITIDGHTKTMTSNKRTKAQVLKAVEIWDFPSLKPGNTLVEVSTNMYVTPSPGATSCEIVVSYIPTTL